MSKIEQSTDLKELEEHALAHLEEEGLREDDELLPVELHEVPIPVMRIALVVLFPVLASAVMVGGIFRGISPRLWGSLAGILGIALAVYVRRFRNAITMNLLIVAGVLIIGSILTIPAGNFEDVINPGPHVRYAIASGDNLRPPVPFSIGWRAIVGWLMGGMGFAAAWVAIQFRKPALGLMLPMVVVAIGAISVSNDAKLLSGLMALVLFAIGLGLLSGIEMGEGEQRSLAYELRRAARALPMIAGITAILFFMAQANFLFPKPRIDPTQEAQRPKQVPITKVPDVVLFTVKATITGPWRMGGLDVYEDNAWKLPPFKDNRIAEVPKDGKVDTELNPGHKAIFNVKGLKGAVLPGLPNLVGLVADGPKLAYDSRTGNIRLAEGQVERGLDYGVTAARIPSIEELRNVTAAPPRDMQKFTEIPAPPPAVQQLISRAPHTSLWDKLDFVRTEFLKIVVAQGLGAPKDVPPSKVQDMLSGSKTGTPFEIVAAQAMLARWLGIPARIGYGFDGGDCEGGAKPPCPADSLREIRPRHGASFLEVYFTGYKWLPIIGTPLQARSSVGNQFTQQNEDVNASDDIAVKIYIPFQVDPQTFLFEQIRAVLAVVVPILLLIALLYYSWPAVRKALLRARRRSWAQEHGPRERIAVAYADWRDLATDFGYRHSSDTPLMFLDRVVEDEEHSEFAWLVTRTLWGDLQDSIRPEDATAAEELAQSLRKRMSQAHAGTLRVVAALSRLSIRYAYAPSITTAMRDMKQTRKGRDNAKAA